jgi:hypothetical protein
MKLLLPADAPDGKYNLALWLPDESGFLQNDPRYAIRFANDGIWDNQTGYNILAEIEVDSKSIGFVDPTNQEFILLP